MIWMIFIKILKNIIQIKNEKNDMLSNKKLNPIVTELFFRGRKLNNLKITQSYFAVPRNIKRNSTHYFVVKISN